MQSPPASTLPRFADSSPRALSASRGGGRSASRTHVAACVIAGTATFLLAYVALQLVGSITGWHPSPLFGAAPPIPLFWRLEVAGLSAVVAAILVLPACRIDMDRTLRWILSALYLAIAAIGLIAVLFP